MSFPGYALKMTNAKTGISLAPTIPSCLPKQVATGRPGPWPPPPPPR